MPDIVGICADHHSGVVMPKYAAIFQSDVNYAVGAWRRVVDSCAFGLFDELSGISPLWRLY